MDSVISQLDQKYSEFLTALDNRSYHNVFRCVYEYFDIIHGQKDLLKIIDVEKQEIERKKKMLDSDNALSARDKKETIRRIENESLSFGYNKINDRIYLPMKNYKESLIISPKESLTGRALVVKEQNKNAGEYLLDLFFSSAIGDIEPIKILWTRFKYFCFTDNVAVYMEKLHSGLIKKKLELPVIQFKEEKRVNKIKIVIDDRKGIYQAGKEQNAYGVERDSNRMKLIKHLIAKDNCGIVELEDITHQSTNVTIKSIAKINELFRENLHLTDDLILSLKTGGYSLNKDIFDITVKP
jgi:hypothetical protein